MGKKGKHMPRVVAGTCRGIPLIAPKGEKTRPTTDKVKEALFSILQNRLPDASFLDLFAGCGQMGIEAVSRGAKEAVLVDENNGSGEAIVQNIAKTKTGDQIRFVKKDAGISPPLPGRQHGPESQQPNADRLI